MKADKSKHDSRQNENMNREEPTKCRAADGITTKNEARHPVTDDRNTSRLFGRDHDRPCRRRIPPEELPGKSHSEREGEQQDSGGPSHLARKFVGAKQKRLRHMRSDHQHHRRRAEVMKSAQEASKRCLVSYEQKSLVSLRRRRDV